jgi:hypothetical protein
METLGQIFWILVLVVQNFNGVFMPFIVDFVNTRVQSSKGRFWVSIISTLVVASLLNINVVMSINSLEDAALFIGKVSFIFAQAQIIYKQWWEKSETRAKLLTK